jgi:nucleoid DNA-binding protein
MDISIYITDLLEEHEYVIIPGLGAFISSSRPAEFSDNNNILLPPSRALSFNPELKINDGLLTRYIAQQQKITLTQAARVLEQYKGDVMYQLEAGEVVFIGNIGSLTLKQGQLMFSPAESSKENSESFGLEPVVVSDYKPDSFKKEEIAGNGKSGKRFIRWIWIGSFLLIFLIALSLYFVFSTTHQTIKEAGPVIQQDTLDNQKPGTVINPDSSVIEQDEIHSVLKDTLTRHPRKELYYTIGGSFRSQQNANEYFEKMNQKGFHPIQLGLIGNFYLVALDTFFTADDAFEAADLYAPVNRKTEIWVYHLK